MINKKQLFTLAGTVLAALIVLTQTAAISPHHRQSKLGGTWISHRVDNTVDTFRATTIMIPLDPAGKTASMRASAVQWTPGYESVVFGLGGASTSDSVGEAKMISNNKAVWTMVAYEQTLPPVKITAIEVYSGTFTITGSDTAVVEYSLKVYLPSADTDGDGMPDTGEPIHTADGLVDACERVPILQ